MEPNCHDALATIIFFVVVFLLMTLASEPPKKTKEDSLTNIRLTGMKTRQEINRLSNDLKRQQLEYLREISIDDSENDSKGE